MIPTASSLLIGIRQLWPGSWRDERRELIIITRQNFT